MIDLSKIISVEVNREVQVSTGIGFGTVLLFSKNTAPSGFTNSVGTYTSESYSNDFPSSSAEGLFLSRLFGQSNTPASVKVGFLLSTDADIDEALERLKDADGSFYCVCPVGSFTNDELLSIAGWVETRSRISIMQDAEASSLLQATSDDVGSVIQDSNLKRTAVYWTGDVDDNIHGAICGRVLPEDPGSSTFAFKTLSGFSVSDALTSSAVAVLDGKNMNYFGNIANQNVSFNGTTASGEFLDITRSIDWLTDQIEVAIAGRLISEDKIPFTDDGIDILSNSVLGVLNLAIRNNVLAEGASITAIPVSQISSSDRGRRVYGDIIVTARLQGAVHHVDIKLNLST